MDLNASSDKENNKLKYITEHDRRNKLISSNDTLAKQDVITLESLREKHPSPADTSLTFEQSYEPYKHPRRMFTLRADISQTDHHQGRMEF